MDRPLALKHAENAPHETCSLIYKGRYISLTIARFARFLEKFTFVTKGWVFLLLFPLELGWERRRPLALVQTASALRVSSALFDRFRPEPETKQAPFLLAIVFS